MGRAAWRRRKTALLVGVAAVACALGLLASAIHLFRRTEQQTIDARFSIRGPERAPADIVLVNIDNLTLREMRRRGLSSEFPFPRRYDAHLIDRLRTAGAKVIALDLQFTQPTDESDDNALAEALERARGKVVLAATDIGVHGESHLIGEGQLGARPASAIETLDSDGEIRRMPYAFNGLRSFPVVTTELASGERVSSLLFSGGTLPIDFVAGPGAFQSIPYSRVLLGQFSPSLFAGKIVIVGASASVLQDVHATATTGEETMSGPEVWANATSTLLRGAPLKEAPGWLEILVILLMGAISPLGSVRLRPRRSLLSTAALAVVFTIAVQVAFNKGLIVDYIYPMFALALGMLGTLAVLYLINAIERERVRDLFSRFVPVDVVDLVVASTGEDLRLGGVELDCTVLFSDLRSFTSFSESQPAARVIEVVNFYLNEMTEAILAAGGTLIAYMGDGIMAAFGAPLEQDDHADRALRAAREMIGPRLAKFNAWLASQGHESGFAMGVGLNSGPVMAGNVGAEQRVEYTTIGDTTNTASRLEGMTKGSGHMLFCAQSTRERMNEPPEDLIFVGEFEVRGREAKLPVWTLSQSGQPESDESRAAGSVEA